jgi:hypothetical protein
MKINLPRRTRAFLAKWGGVVMATVLIIPIALLGGTFLMANSRIDSTLNFVTQAVTLNGFIFAGPTPDLPPDYVYRLSIIVHNGTADAADVEITDAGVTIGKLAYEITGSAGWSGRVEAKDYTIFEGDITILRSQYKELENKPVTLKISGTLNVKGRYGFVEKTETRLIRINPIVIFPPPETITPTLAPEITIQAP